MPFGAQIQKFYMGILPYRNSEFGLQRAFCLMKILNLKAEEVEEKGGDFPVKVNLQIMKISILFLQAYKSIQGDTQYSILFL